MPNYVSANCQLGRYHQKIAYMCQIKWFCCSFYYLFFCLGSKLTKMIFTLSNLISWTSFFYSYPDSKMYVYSFRKNQIPKKLQLNPKLKPSLPVNTFTQWSKLKKKMKSISEIIVASKQKKLVIIVVHNQAIFINLRNSTFKKHKKTYYLLTYIIKKTSY